MLKKNLLKVGTIAIVSFIWSCGGITPYHQDSSVNKNWGRSVETAKYNQIINPEAGKNIEAVSGFDGSAGESNLEKYKDSFKKTGPKEVVNVIKIK